MTNVVIIWKQDCDIDLLTTNDGKDVFCYWWDDVRPREVADLVKRAYECGYSKGTEETNTTEKEVHPTRKIAREIVDIFKKCDNVSEDNIMCFLERHFYTKAKDLAEKNQKLYEEREIALKKLAEKENDWK